MTDETATDEEAIDSCDWDYIYDPGGQFEWLVIAREGESKGPVAWCYHPNAKARARLIAAAPDLLRTLNDAEQKLTRAIERRMEEWRYTADLEQIEESIHDAIDKATP